MPEENSGIVYGDDGSVTITAPVAETVIDLTNATKEN